MPVRLEGTKLASTQASATPQTAPRIAPRSDTVGGADKETDCGSGKRHQRQDKADEIDCRLGVFAHCSYPRLTLSMPTIRS
jgi:hypothetical protein